MIRQDAPEGARSRASDPLFATATVVGMLLVGVLAIAAFLSLSAYAPDLRAADDPGAHALSRSAAGFSALVRLTRATGAEALILRQPLARLKGGSGLLVLTPGPQTDPKRIAKLAWRGPILIVLPKWTVTPHPLHKGWVFRGPALSDRDVLQPLATLAPKAQLTRSAKPILPWLHASEAGEEEAPADGLRFRRVENLQSLSGPGLTAVLSAQDGRAILTRIEGSHVYVLADPDLLANVNMKTLADARGALGLVTLLSQGRAVSFDVSLNGFERARSLLRLAFEPPFAALTLCFAAAAALAGLYAFARFGPALHETRALALGKAALADNSAALIRMAGRLPKLAPAYLDLVRRASARAAAAPRTLDADALDAYLDRIAASRNFPVRMAELTRQANQGLRTPQDLLRFARSAYDFRREMTRERH